MAILRRATSPDTNHEVLFIERYQRLLGSALQLTDGNRERAEDLVHDAFIQFTFSRPDLSAIENLDGYLYGMLRKLHLSQMRRESRSRIQPHFLVEYDSAETGLHMIDPRDRLQAQEELRRVCHYACARKETSTIGSVLILRFFHGYYPSEITKVIQGSRHSVDLRLRRARAEAKASLADPQGLVFMKEQPVRHLSPNSLAPSTLELLSDLRRTIFRSRQGDCFTREQLHSLYESDERLSIACPALAHIVSCQMCLDEVNKMHGLPLLSERYPVDTMGKDESSKGSGRGPSGGSGAGGVDGGGVVRCRRRAREVFEHRPQELHISVNGFIQGSQKINSEQNEQTLDIDMAEQIGFVEIFSEQETRLLFLDVEPPPAGSVEQKTRVELSNDRTLDLTLSFRGAWPTLQTIYCDPLLKSERESESDLEPESDAEKDRPDELVQGPRSKIQRRLGRGLGLIERVRNRGFGIKNKETGVRRWTLDLGLLLRPVTVTAIIAVILVAALLSVLLRTQPPAVTAADLLQRSIVAEDAIAGRVDQVLHRTITLEEKKATGELIARRRIEVWQSAERGLTVRRLYDENNALVAGDWRRSDGVQTLYQHGVKPQLQLTPERRGGSSISFDSVWQLDPSAKQFSALIGANAAAQIQERPGAYVVSYSNPQVSGNNTSSTISGSGRGLAPASPAGDKPTGASPLPNLLSGPGILVQTTLVINKGDLHVTEQSLFVRQGDETREYRFTETAFEQRPPNDVAPVVFEPDAVFLSLAKPETRNAKPETLASVPDPNPPPPVAASAELEVEVLRLLHQAGADLGEQVSVTRGSDGVLRVEGVFDTDQRKSEVLRSLQPVMNNPAVKVDVQTVSEALKRQSQSRQPAGQITIQPPESTANTVPVEDELRRYFTAKGFKDAQIDDQARRFSNRMLDQSREAMAHAWALKRLANRFSPEQSSALDKDARTKWLAMIAEHARALTQQTISLRQELQRIFPNLSSENVTEEIELSSDKDLARAIERLFDLCSQYTQIVRSAFIISSENTNAQVIRTEQFWRTLKRTERLAARIGAVARP